MVVIVVTVMVGYNNNNSNGNNSGNDNHDDDTTTTTTTTTNNNNNNNNTNTNTTTNNNTNNNNKKKKKNSSSFPCAGNSRFIFYTTSQLMNQLHGAESFLRSHQSLNYSRISQHFMESVGSLLCSQEPSTDLYRVRWIQSIPLHHISLRSILILSSHLRLSVPSGLFPYGFITKILYSTSLHPCYMSCPSHPKI
jgi:hypothetical protein